MKGDRAFAAAFVALCVLALVPIWAVRYPPFTDLGYHLAAISVWARHGDPAWEIARYYDLALGATPYWGYYALVRYLSVVTGLHVANKLVLSLCVVGLPLATLYLCVRFQRSRWLSLAAFSLIYTLSFNWGFVSFVLGLVCAMFGIGLFDRYCERPRWTTGAGAALLGSLTYICHLLPWGLYLGAAGLVGLLHGQRTPRRMAGRLAIWLSALATGVLVLRLGTRLHMGGPIGAFHGKFYPIRDHLRSFYDWVWNGCTGREDELLAGLFLAAWIVLKATAGRARRPLLDFRPEACFATAFLAYLLLPRSLLSPSYWWGINVRFAVPALLFLALCVQGPIAGWRRALVVPLALAGAGFLVDATVHGLRAARYMDGFSQLARVPARQDRVLVIVYPPWRDPSYGFDYARTYAAWYAVEKGGYMPWHWDEGFPLKYRLRYPAPNWSAPRLKWEKQAPFYDYLLTFQEPPGQLRGHEHEAKLVEAAGRWRLYRLPGPRQDEPGGPPYPWTWAYD
jgi:hypothetical protein